MRILSIIASLVLALLGGCAGTAGSNDGQWVSAWAASHNARAVTPAMSGKTVRMVLAPTLSGNSLRVKIENTMGEAPVVFSAAFIGVAGEAAALRQGSNTRLSFNGRPGVTLAPGQGVYSDPVGFDVKASDKLALSLDVESAADISVHHVGLRTNWMASGARASDPSGAGFEPLPEVAPANAGNWPFYWVAALDVRSATADGAIVLFADSITDGRCSTRDDKGVVQPNLYQRWGDVMAARLAADPRRAGRKGVVNAGIAGNRVLNRGNGPSALERVERDVLDRAGLSHVVFFEATNDIAGDFSAAQIAAGTKQIIDKVHAAAKKIIGVTVIPRGRPAPETGWTSANERERLAVNRWIRREAGFDGVIDFDALMKDGPVYTLADGGTAPGIPPAWNCDRTHPNAAGYKAMGEFVDLTLFDTARLR